MPIAYTYKRTRYKLYKALAFLFVISAFAAKSQIVVSPPPGGNNYAQLLQNFFVGGGVTVSNVQYTGNANQIGSFTCSGTPMQISAGIILSTGNRTGAAAPNNGQSSASTSYSRPGITQLNALAGTTTYDGAQLQFDFVTLSNTVTFRYVFASEEYPEYAPPNSGVNDVFAFFIQGPGFPTWTNIALIPNTNQPVSINNVNPVTNSQYYISNPVGGGNVEYDGMTRRMLAQATVQPCQTYTLRIAIADAGDWIYDSAVFLEQNSFNGGLVNITASGTTPADTSSTEGCDPARFNFALANPLTQPYTINFTLAGTAQNGVDYQTLPSSITIPAGQTSAQLTVNSIMDGIPEGVETVDLIYQAPCGPETTRVFIKNVNPIVVTAAQDVSMCAGGGPVNLSAQITGGVAPFTYTWDNGGGTGQSVQVSPTQTTTYTCTVTGACNMQGTDQQVVTVYPIPTATFTTNAPVCPGTPVNITYIGTASANATYNWVTTGAASTSGSGQNIQATYANSGFYTISLTVTENGCTSPSSSIPISIYSLPASTFSINPTAVCAGANATITYTGTPVNGATYNWNFGNGTVVSGSGQGPYQVNWPTGGTQNVSLYVVANGCTGPTTTQQVTVYDIPTADFSVGGPICEGSDVNMQYTGTADTSAATFAWNLGGGTIATNPVGEQYTINYASAGTPTISLTVTENGCVSQPVTHSVTVNAIPASTFTYPTQLCLNATGAFEYNGIAGPNATYAWNFAGGTIASGSNAGPVNVSWATIGIKHVTLQVTDNGCVGAPYDVDVTINDIPTSDFSATTNLCMGAASDVQYSGTGSGNATYTWNFDGGSIINGASGAGPYQIDWNAAGTFDIDLTVTENGCTSTVTTHQVAVGSNPAANAGPDVTVCSGQPVQIGNAAVPGAVYEWITNLTDITDPTQSQQQFTPINTLNPIGPEVRTYTLQVDLNGCLAFDDVVVTINPQPIAAFVVPTPQCLSINSYDFVAGGSYSNNASFSWAFGPNTSTPASALQNPTGIVFTTAGPQTVTLDIDDYGCTASYTADINVLAEPVASFSGTPLSGCPPLVVDFTDLSGYGNTATYLWNFGDGTTSTEQNPQHTYTETDSYNVTLQVSLGVGCRSTAVEPNYVTVYPVPTASFVVSPDGVDMLNPYITVTSTATGGNNITCEYNINDVTFFTDCNWDYTFADTGNYVITQYVENEFGCKDNTIHRIVVNPASALYIPNSFTPNEDNLNDVFFAQGVAIKNFELSIFNRWGERIFHTTNLNEGWDGTGSDRKMCQIDVYPYYVSYEDIKGKRHELRGHISLIR